MAFFNQAITVLQTLVIALGAGLSIWGVINLLEGCLLYTSIIARLEEMGIQENDTVDIDGFEFDYLR